MFGLPIGAILQALPWVLLALSIAGGCALHKVDQARLHHEQAESGRLRGELAAAVVNAKACSDGVKAVRDAEQERKREAAKAVDAAARQFTAAERTAQVTLQSAPAVVAPAGAPVEAVAAADCSSARVLMLEQLRVRRERGPS